MYVCQGIKASLHMEAIALVWAKWRGRRNAAWKGDRMTKCLYVTLPVTRMCNAPISKIEANMIAVCQASSTLHQHNAACTCRWPDADVLAGSTAPPLRILALVCHEWILHHTWDETRMHDNGVQGRQRDGVGQLRQVIDFLPVKAVAALSRVHASERAVERSDQPPQFSANASVTCNTSCCANCRMAEMPGALRSAQHR